MKSLEHQWIITHFIKTEKTDMRLNVIAPVTLNNNLEDTEFNIKTRVFSPENGDSMFLRNAGMYLRVYTASQPTSATSSCGLSCLCVKVEDDGGIFLCSEPKWWDKSDSESS